MPPAQALMIAEEKGLDLVEIFRGREMVHNEIGRRILTRLAVELTEVALVEVPPRQEGMTMVQILSPKKDPAAKAAKPASAGKTAKKKEAAGEEGEKPKPKKKVALPPDAAEKAGTPEGKE
jgi:translation initiation factor IF-3